VTDLVHGESATRDAMRASEILFGGGLDGIAENVFPRRRGRGALEGIAKAKLDGEGLSLVELLVHSGLCPSKGQARKDVEGGGIYLNNVRETNAARPVLARELLFGRHLLLRKGKRNYVVVSMVG
jgi:tyrosyl-tRNA synthetase